MIHEIHILKQLNRLPVLCCVWIFLFSFSYSTKIIAQPCSGSTPSFTIDLTGSPDSIWTSPSTSRNGLCCGVSNPDVCIEFILILDTLSNGIKFTIPFGALPGGALFYQIGCGTVYQVGQNICLSGRGPHRITFCKPGNNANVYQIKALSKPKLSGKFFTTQACFGYMKVIGLEDTSINWTSVPYNATYNSFLNCTAGCDSVSIVPTGIYPPSITYRVCGNVIGGCTPSLFCDTGTVRFVSNIEVSILPKNPSICFGGSSITISATPVGGLPPFRYLWNTGDTTQSLNVGVGKYVVSMYDSVGCGIARDSVNVIAFSSSILANAGNDTSICSRRNFVFLNGKVQAASGGIWKNGRGVFVPNDTTLNAIYFPDTSETNAGFVNLKLVTTGNGTCPPDSNIIHITINPTPIPIINGPINVCERKQNNYSTNSGTGFSYLWSVSGGIIQGTTTDTSIKILWGINGVGIVTLTQTNSFGCDSAVTKSITINPTPVPIIITNKYSN